MATVSDKKNKKTNPILKPIWKWTKKIFFWLFIFQLFCIILFKWVNPPITITQFMSWAGGHGLARDYISSSNISSNAKLAVIAAEDQTFPDHSGFDWKSIRKAVQYNDEHDNKRRGASTISQQVAKNVFLWQGGGYFRKGLEMYFTFMIELVWGKKRILEVYLNVIEMGDGIFGIEMAAQKYFNKPAKSLSQNEAAMIAACLPNPKRYTVKPISGYVSKKAQWVQQQMNNLSADPDVQNLIGTNQNK